jgi:hypothetical protein
LSWRLYGYTGLCWREDRVALDPMLPPQLAGGLRLTGLRWQGRLFDVELGPATSALTLRSGAPAQVETPAGTREVSVGAPLRMPTRTAGPDADNQARCRPVTANAADPSAPVVAAVDGSAVTAWTPDTDPATPSMLTVRLADIPTLGPGHPHLAGRPAAGPLRGADPGGRRLADGGDGAGDGGHGRQGHLRAGGRRRRPPAHPGDPLRWPEPPSWRSWP